MDQKEQPTHRENCIKELLGPLYSTKSQEEQLKLLLLWSVLGSEGFIIPKNYSSGQGEKKNQGKKHSPGNSEAALTLKIIH